MRTRSTLWLFGECRTFGARSQAPLARADRGGARLASASACACCLTPPRGKSQVAGAYGTNVGGVNPALIIPGTSDSSAYDSWLTIGKTEGDGAGELTPIGIDWDAWTPGAVRAHAGRGRRLAAPNI